MYFIIIKEDKQLCAQLSYCFLCLFHNGVYPKPYGNGFWCHFSLSVTDHFRCYLDYVWQAKTGWRSQRLPLYLLLISLLPFLRMNEFWCLLNWFCFRADGSNTKFTPQLLISKITDCVWWNLSFKPKTFLSWYCDFSSFGMFCTTTYSWQIFDLTNLQVSECLVVVLNWLHTYRYMSAYFNTHDIYR